MKRVLLTACLMITVAVLTAFFVGCGTDSNVTGNDSQSPVSETSTTEICLLDEAGQPRYRIIRSEDADAAGIEAAKTIFMALQEKSGVRFTFTTDFLKKGETADDVYEILVGSTSRAESAAAATEEGLPMESYRIRVMGKKIVIIGGGTQALMAGAEAFIALLDDKLCFAADEGFCLSGQVAIPEKLIGMTNQSQSRIEVYNIGKGALNHDTLVWSHSMPYNNVADVKLRVSQQHGEVALAVCGSSYACMVTYPGDQVVWQTMAAANNPHSIELLPGEVIAVASSDGGAIRFFDGGEKVSGKYTEFALSDAHGVLWDPENEVLWALGRNVLTALTVEKGADGVIKVSEVSKRRATVPTDYGHDLSPVYGDTNQLWLTTSSAVYRFDKSTQKFTTDYPGNDLINRSGTKSIGNYPDGTVVTTIPDGAYYSWTTKTVRMISPVGSGYAETGVKSLSGDFYKCRVWCRDYQ